VALGLGRSEQPSAVGMLADAYRDEADSGVRRAIVRALAVRGEPARRRTLAFAAELEPDDDARTLARAALGGTPEPGAGPRSPAWLRLRGGSEPSFATVTAADGLARPFAADPDGTVTVFGLPAGDIELTLGVAAPGRVPPDQGKP
jgi:HEAT repeat protein